MQCHVVAAVLGLAPDQPGQVPLQPPEPWRTLLLHDHLDAKSRLALLRSCTAGRDWVVQASKHMILTLHACDDPQLTTRMTAAARQILQLRGVKPTKLGLERGGASMGSMVPLAGELQGAGHVTALELGLSPSHTRTPQHTPEQYVPLQAAVVAAWGGQLRKLTVRPLHATLPAPSALPQLTELTVHLDTDDESVCISIAAYLPQLSSLNLRDCKIWAPNPALSSVFSNSTCLRSFTAAHTLTAQVVRLLVRYTPALKEITVYSVELQEDCSDLTWAVEQLVSQCLLDMVNMARLPHSSTVLMAGGRYSRGLHARAADIQGLALAVRERLPGWCCQVIYLEAARSIPSADQPAALQASLQQLASMHTGSLKVNIGFSGFDSYWDYTPELIRTLTATLAALPQLSITHMGTHCLTDSVLTALLDHAPASVTKVAFKECQITEDYSHRQCQWAQLHIATVNGPQLMWLPSSDTLAVSCWRWNWELTEETRVLAPVHRAALARAHAIWRCYLTCSEGVPAESQPALLRTALEALGCTRVWAPECHKLRAVTLGGWTLTAEVAQELAGLPEWGDILVLSRVTWLPQKGVYEQLPQLIPAHCKSWHVPHISTRTLQDILTGLQGRQVMSKPVSLHVGHAYPDYGRQLEEEAKRMVDSMGLQSAVHVDRDYLVDDI